MLQRQPWLLPTVVLFVVLPVGLAIATAITSSSDENDADGPISISRDGARVVASPGHGKPIAFRDDVPQSYRVVVRSDRFEKGGGKVSSFEAISVRRPFDSHIRITRDGEVVTERATR